MHFIPILQDLVKGGCARVHYQKQLLRIHLDVKQMQQSRQVAVRRQFDDQAAYFTLWPLTLQEGVQMDNDFQINPLKSAATASGGPLQPQLLQFQVRRQPISVPSHHLVILV